MKISSRVAEEGGPLEFPGCISLVFPECIYRVEEEGGPLVFPGPLQEKLSRWLNGDPDLLQEAELQKVVQVK